MYLGYSILAKIFPNTLGLKDSELQFYTATTNEGEKQPRGLFIPLFNNEADLMKAINNGAVAAVWEEERQLPAYTPNLFPIFKTKNMKEDVKKMLELYLEMIKKEADVNEVTHFLIFEGKRHDQAIDQTPMLAEIMNLVDAIEDVRRG